MTNIELFEPTGPYKQILSADRYYISLVRSYMKLGWANWP